MHYQDDADTKQATINQMNLIYENTLVTIIAAEGTDTNARSWQLQRCDLIGSHLKMITPHIAGRIGVVEVVKSRLDVIKPLSYTLYDYY